MRILQKLFLTVATLFCSTAATWAQTTFENEAGTLKFTVTEGTNVSVAKGTNKPSGALEIPAKVTYPETDGVEYTVTSMGSQAFYECSGLISVTFAEGSQLKNIGNWAFAYCSNLTSVNIPQNVTNIDYMAFNYCSKLSSITIPASVTSIGENSFYECSSLTSVTFAEGSQLSSIWKYAFSECTALTSIAIPTSVKSIGEQVFSGCTKLTEISVNGNNTEYASENGVLFNKAKTTLIYCPAGKTGAYSIPEGVTSICDYAFYNCSKLTSITLPESVTSVGNSAFYGCSLTYNTFDNAQYLGTNQNQYQILMKATSTSISSCEINSKCKAIAGGAFYNCSSLASISIHEGIEGIGSRAFYACTGLTSITIPQNVSCIGKDAFCGCNNLTSVTINNNVDYSNASLLFKKDDISYMVLDQETISFSSIWNTYSGESFIIPETVTAGNTFNVTAINNNALTSSRITSLTISKSITSIGENVFMGCQLEEIIVADGNTAFTVEDNVLFNKDKTTLIYCCQRSSGSYVIPETVTELKAAAFMGSSLTTLTIPESITSISSSPFYTFFCKNVIVPESVTNVADNAFSYNACVDVINVTYSGNLPEAPWGAKYLNGIVDGDFIYSDESKTAIIAYIGSDSDVAIPSSVTNICDYAFENDNNLTSVTIPNTVTIIGDNVFAYSSNVTLYCEFEESSKPSGWSSNWNKLSSWQSIYCPVEWGCKVVRVAVEGSEIGNVTANGENYAVKSSDGSFWYLAATANGTNTLTASPAAHFVKWSDNNTDNPRIVNVTNSESITAIFSAHNNSVGFENVVAATCTTPGSHDSVVYCSICKEEFSRTKVDVPATGHKDSVAIENVVEATRTAAGSYDSVVYCSVCRVELSRTTVKVPQIVAETIKLASKPNKVEYKQGEALDVKGGKITIGYTDQSTDDYEILPNWVSGFNSEKVGKQTLTVTFEAVSSTLTTTFDVAVSAKDDDNTAIDEDAANAVNIYAYQNVIVVENATEEISVYNAMGALVCRDSARHASTADGLGARTEIRMNNAGVYIVKVGNVAKRVFINR